MSHPPFLWRSGTVYTQPPCSMALPSRSCKLSLMRNILQLGSQGTFQLVCLRFCWPGQKPTNCSIATMWSGCCLLRITSISEPNYYSPHRNMFQGIYLHFNFLLNRGIETFETMGSLLEQSSLWPSMEPYFHMAYWILTYQPNATVSPNCKC